MTLTTNRERLHPNNPKPQTPNSKLLHFFKLDIIITAALRRRYLLRFWTGLIAILLCVLLHALLHFPETLFDLAGSAVYGNDEVKDQFPGQIEEEGVEKKP